MRKQPRFRQTIEIGFQRDRFLQHVAHCTKQPGQILVAQSGRLSGRVHACAEKNFVRVKVPDPGDQLLVEQNRFHGAAVFSEDRFELGEIDVERVRTDAASLQKLSHILDQFDLAKFSLIVEREPAVVRESKKDARSFRRGFVVVEVLERAGHAEMQPYPQLITGPHEQMFAVPVTVFESTPFESTCQLTRGNAFQNIRVSHVDIGDPLAQRRAVQVSFECFDFGQLWHRAYVCT